MYYYKALIQYDGTNYFGFQWQKGLPSIQNTFNESLGQIRSGKVTTMGASRTDTGVHAVEQIVKITSEKPIKIELVLPKLNRALPSQIKCLDLLPCEGSFKPTVGSYCKEYRYLFTNLIESSCIDQKFIANNPYRLDIEQMKKCAQTIVGTHDFQNFYSAGSNVKSTIRDISFCELSKIDPHVVLPQTGVFSLPLDLRECFQLKIVGNGFLKQMVRHLMSALWLVGGGKISPDEFDLLLKGPQKTKRLWKVATPRGLYLYKITDRCGAS
jgi:tRNA pseudouridine38-40 synthase